MNRGGLFNRGWSRLRVQSIRTRVILGFVLMSLLTALSISLGSTVVGYFNTRQQALDRLESAISLREIEILNWNNALQNELLFALNDVYSFEQIPVVLNLAYRHQYYDWYNEAVKNRLISLTSQSKLIHQYCLLDLQGRVILCTDPDWAGNDCSNQSFYSQGLNSTYTELPFPQPEAAPGCWIKLDADQQGYALVSRPVINSTKQVVGVIVGRANVSNIAAILANSTGLGRTGRAYLINPDIGVLSVDQPTDGKLSPQTKREIEISKLLSSNSSNESKVVSGIFEGLEGQQVMSVGVWLSDLKSSLVVEQDISDAFQSIQVNLLVSLGIGLAAALITIFTSIFITRAIVRPIDQLANIATEIAGGNLERSAPVQGRDEIATLAQAFNSMTAQLKDLILHLEQRVQDRTHALQETNQALEQRALQLETSAAVSRMITVNQELRELLPEVVAYIGKAFHYSDVRIYLLEKDCLVLKAYSQAVEPQVRSIPLGATSLNTEAIKSRKSILVGDRPNDPRVLVDLSQPNLLSELAVPLLVGKRVVGTLDVSCEETNAFSPEDVLLLQSLGDQIAVAVENERLYHRTLELAVLGERSRLARNLHDSVVQSLYSLNLMMSGWLEHIRAGDVSNVSTNFERASEIIHQALKEMRLMVYQLNPRVLVQEGLETALRRRLDSVESRAGVKTYLTVPENLHLPARIEESLYHIAQEALNNALKHSGESEVHVSLTQSERKNNGKVVILEIQDNGEGFSDETVDLSGMGLSNMKQRAEEQKGIFSLVSSPGQGTTVRVEIPLPAQLAD